MGRWKEHLAFNRRERYGVVVLCTLLLVVSLIRASWDRLNPPEYPDVSFSECFVEKDTVFTNWGEKNTEYFSQVVEPRSDDARKLVTVDHYFNPNELTSKGWVELGFSEKQAMSLIKFKNVLGGFNSPKDVGKSFVVSEDKLNQLRPWMVFDNEEVGVKDKEQNLVTKSVDLIEINKADSAELIRINGVGPFYAGAIVQLRKELGGFTSYDQLMGLYGMDEIKLAKIMEQCSLDSTLAEVRNINKVSIEELNSHLYLDYKVARSIVKYREQHGDYQSLEDLLNVHLMNDSILKRIRPFFAVHD